MYYSVEALNGTASGRKGIVAVMKVDGQSQEVEDKCDWMVA
jgi:hypothetical protein